jgi:hypothetical protein
MGLRTGLSAPARRLPDRLDDLHGPWQGTVVLPVHLSWHQFREFDVARHKARLLLYSIVISQGRRNDVARFLNAERLREDWPEPPPAGQQPDAAGLRAQVRLVPAGSDAPLGMPG